MNRIGRRYVLTGGGVALAALGVAGFGIYQRAFPPPAPVGFDVSPEELAQARALLARHPSIDAHAHPGRTFVDGAENLSGLIWVYAKLGHFEQKAVKDMQAGGLTVAAFAAVSDFQVLGPEGEGLTAKRAFEPGEAWASYQRQIGHLKSLAAQGLVVAIKAPADIETARATGKVGALLAVEGGDFLEGKPERVELAYADGVRSITLMHYRSNELGDIITGPPRNGRLTPAGLSVVKAMNRAGMLIDVAHASSATASSLSDLGNVGCKPTAAVHFSPSF